MLSVRSHDPTAVAALTSNDPPRASGSASEAPPVAFETALAELESLVQQMEGGSLTLEQSVGAYRRGAELIRHCRETLASVRQQVRILEGDVLQPFGDDEDAR